MVGLLLLAALSLLLLLPIFVYRLAKRARSRRAWALTGLSFGLVISPASLGLYMLCFVHPAASIAFFLPGMLGLASSLIHMEPGFEIITALGLRDAHTVTNSQETVTIYVINGLFWGIVYGALGRLIDFIIAHRAD